MYCTDVWRNNLSLIDEMNRNKKGGSECFRLFYVKMIECFIMNILT